MKIGQRIKVLREKAGWSQTRLAEASGVPQPTISRIEQGKVRDVKSEDLKRLATALGVSVDDLVADIGEPKLNIVMDSNVLAILEIYANLPAAKRVHLLDFARYLEQSVLSEHETVELAPGMGSRKRRSRGR